MKKIILGVALSQLGIKEDPAGDNPEITKYFQETGWDKQNLNEETAWCSAFAIWVAKKAGYIPSEKLNARSWLDVGYKVWVPQPGDIAVFWRGSKSSWKGHVGFFMNQDEENVYVLGGNQRNSVSIMAIQQFRLLGIRRLVRAT